MEYPEIRNIKTPEKWMFDPPEHWARVEKWFARRRKMLVKDLIELLQQHNPDAEVHVCNDRGYYEYVGEATCSDKEAFEEKWFAENDLDDEDDGFWPEAPDCDDSCKNNSPVVIYVD